MRLATLLCASASRFCLRPIRPLLAWSWYSVHHQGPLCSPETSNYPSLPHEIKQWRIYLQVCRTFGVSISCFSTLEQRNNNNFAPPTICSLNPTVAKRRRTTLGFRMALPSLRTSFSWSSWQRSHEVGGDVSVSQAKAKRVRFLGMESSRRFKKFNKLKLLESSITWMPISLRPDDDFQRWSGASTVTLLSNSDDVQRHAEGSL